VGGSPGLVQRQNDVFAQHASVGLDELTVIGGLLMRPSCRGSITSPFLEMDAQTLASVRPNRTAGDSVAGFRAWVRSTDGN
jgi:hypothetical protein